jgi:glucosyl-3-phosphoglycerate synthase
MKIGMNTVWQTVTGLSARIAAVWHKLRGRGPGPAPDSQPLELLPPAVQTVVTPAPRSVSVIIPALNEAARIASVVHHALADPVTAEVIVVDDSSTDNTAALAAAAGARVITSSMLGKGRSMLDGLRIAQHELVAYLDGDLNGLRAHILTDLATPLAAQTADFVKARFGRGGGRVTELTAKPMLKLFFPELAKFSQPLGGIIAARTSLLQTLTFEDGYGVDVGLLIDAHRAGARLAEVDIGSLEHESQSLPALGLMAQEVGRVIFDRAKRAGRLTVDQILSIYELERQNLADIDNVLVKLRDCEKIALFCMDGVVLPSCYLTELAVATGRSAKLSEITQAHANVPVNGGSPPPHDFALHAQQIAAVFKFVHKTEFEAVAHALQIRPQMIETVNALRRAGYKVGVISDGYFIAAEIVRRRLFADFALANTMLFEADVCQGDIRLNRAFSPRQAGRNDAESYAARHVLDHIRHDDRDVPLAHVIAVGSAAHDLPLLEAADFSFAIDPRSAALRNAPGVIELKSMDELVTYTQSMTAVSLQL